MAYQVFESIEKPTIESVLFALKWSTLYMVYMVLGTKLLPSTVYKFKIANTDKVYKINGLKLFVLTTLLAPVLITFTNFTLIPIITKFWSFFIVANIYGFGFSIFLFVYAKIFDSPDTHHVHQDYLPDIVSDFWFGIRRNPEFFGIDLKMFFYQPSLIGLYVIVTAFAEYQYVTFGYLSIQMILFLAFWWLYLYFHYVKEEFMLSTWDIIAENFGFMLIWGDLVYLPFLYSIGAWYMVDTADSNVVKPIGYVEAALYAILFTVGHYILRVSNMQKFQFKLNKANPNSWFFWWNCGKLNVLEDKILCSGFWGIGRHLNYTGEILAYLAIALVSGCQSFVPYILPFSLLLLLTQRAWRDEQRCRQKYGKLWEKYCRIAKFRMIPYIY